MNIAKFPSGPARAKTLRRPVTDAELERLVDSYMFNDKVTPEDRERAKEGELYPMLKRAAMDFYRLGEKGARPK